MDSEDKELLKRNVELAEANNDMLRSMQRSMRLARIGTLVYWVVIIAIAAGAYYLIQPYVDQVKNAYGDVSGTFSTGMDNFGDINGIIEKFKSQFGN